MATRNNVETAILPIRRVDSRPRSDSRLRVKPSAEVEFVLMPREAETNLGCFPDKQCVDAEYIWTEQINEWVG